MDFRITILSSPLSVCSVFLRLPVTVSGLAKVAILRTNFHTKNQSSNLRKTVLRRTSPPLAPNPCYRQWFCLSCQCPPCFQRFYSPLTCPENGFCQSAMSGRERFNFCEARRVFFCLTVRLLLAYFFVCGSALALCRPQERGRQCAKSV